MVMRYPRDVGEERALCVFDGVLEHLMSMR